MKNHFRPSFGLQRCPHERHVHTGQNLRLSSTPKTCQKYAQNTLGTETILSRGGREKIFNRGLMNKLMKIECVSE